MNKYQEAINELYKQRAERYKVYQKHKDWSKEIKEYDKVGEALETLQELVDQTKTPTLEEVKKKGEAKMTSKPKLNQPDVESTITSPIGESLNINFTIPSKQFEQVFEKDTNIEKRNLTLEEVKKEWEELGWYWHYFYNENGIANKYRITKYVPSRKRDGSGDYQLEIYLCNNTKTFNINFNMDMQEYQLLTKTFKALGWL